MAKRVGPDHQYDVLIIGSGAAGLSLAIRLASYFSVMVLSKAQLKESATLYAQGGIAAVFDQSDSVESHIEDTLAAGAGLCDRDSASFVASNARHCVQWLADQGVAFDAAPALSGEAHYHLTREGGHRHRRILHHADATGREVETTLVRLASDHPNIRILEYSNAVDLILSDKAGMPGARRVVGAWVWNARREHVETCGARAVVLATGGAAKVYPYSTNPDVATGDGVAMAWRAGCRVANLEFNQFHPTSLYHPQARSFLLTEALRGEGARLLRPDGTRFMPDFDQRAELAPRDIVARAMDQEMKQSGVDCMYLDISHKPSAFVKSHFPTLYEKLFNFGLDLTKDAIPVVPAAHYTCGGVMVDRQGRSDVAGLYAIGEVSYTGLHGANRLASNSLLECVVYGWSAAEALMQTLPQAAQASKLPSWERTGPDNAEISVVSQHQWHELRQLMWDHVGIVRTTAGLERALRRIILLRQETEARYATFSLSAQLLELRNLSQVAELMVRSALARKESRGLHFTLDYPQQLTEARPTILISPYMNK